MNFSIVVPLYNEGENITLLNDEILKVVDTLKNVNSYNFEIIYVDDGSIDDTFKIISNLKNSISTIIVKNLKNYIFKR